MKSLSRNSEINPLICQAGVRYSQSKHQLENANERVQEYLNGSVEEDWQNSFPIWQKLGRIKDLSKSLRVPKYFPSFACFLGQAFVQKHWQSYSYIVQILYQYAPDSTEALCAYDLLELMIDEFWSKDLPVPEELFAISFPISPVIQEEICGLTGYSELAQETVGECLRCYYQVEYTD